MKNIVITLLMAIFLGVGIYTLKAPENALAIVADKAEVTADAKIDAKAGTSAEAKQDMTLSAKDQTLQSIIERTFPGLGITSFKETGVAGVLEFNIGAQVLYVTEDGRFLFKGNIFDLITQENLTEKAEKVSRVSTLDTFGEDNMLVYKAKDHKRYITVFTDVDCPYCRKLHDEVGEYLKNGISVRYMFLPFKGKNSFDKSVSIMCSKTPLAAMNNAKQGRKISSVTCEHPIKQHMQLGQEFGIRGTPAIIIDNGEMLPGYRPVADVTKMMGLVN